jgi:macrolide-specific efflux system membrane fusion protein
MFAFIKKSFSAISKSRLKTIIAVVVVVLVLLAGWRAFASGSKQPQYQTETAEKGTLVVSISSSGQMVSTGSLPVTTLTSGIVKEVYVKNGDTVTEGQKLLEITPDQTSLQSQTQAWASYQNALNSYNSAVAAKTTAQATLEKDRATVITASSNVDIAENRASALQPNPETGSMYSENDLNVIRSSLTSARETFSADEKKYLDADKNISAAQTAMTASLQAYQQSSTTVVAPASGTIKDLIFAPGMAISAGSTTVSTGTGTSSNSTSRSTSTVARIQTADAADTVPAATFNLSEVDMPKVKVGQHATLTLDALAGKTFTGTVIGVNREGAVSSGVTNYPVIIQLDSSYPDLAPNMSATANIILETKADVLLVPNGAVQTTNGTSTVRVMKNGKVTSVPVEVGASSDTQTEIISGLTEGDTVVTGSNVPQQTSGASGGGSSPFSRSFGGGGGAVMIRK